MSTFGADLIQSLTEALAHAKGEGRAIVHAPITPREVRKRAKLTQAQKVPKKIGTRIGTLDAKFDAPNRDSGELKGTSHTYAQPPN